MEQPLLIADQTRAVLADLRTRFPDREEYRYAAVVLDIGYENSTGLEFLMTVVCGWIDSKAIAVTPSSIIAIDEHLICLTWLVNPATPPEMLELLQQVSS